MQRTAGTQMFSAVLLDLDGTLIDTIGDIAAAANAMLAELRRPALPVGRIRTFVGKGTPKLVERILSEDLGRAPHADEIDRALQIFTRHYRLLNGRQAVVYPGVIPGLEALRSLGLSLAVVTNKPTEFTLPLLEQCGLVPYFAAVVCGDTCPEKKPHPMPLEHACRMLGAAPHSTLVVGDSLNDAQAARAAGMKVLAVPYGYNEGVDVRNFDVDDIVSSIEAAARWVADLENTCPAP